MPAKEVVNHDVLRRMIITAVDHVLGETLTLDPHTVGNGHRPAENTICGKIWEWCDKTLDGGRIPKVSEVLEAGHEKGWNEATVKTQYAAWRRYYGIKAQH